MITINGFAAPIPDDPRVSELAAYIDQQVPNLSFQAFKMRQIPQMKIVDNSFPIVSKATVLHATSTETNADSPAPIQTKPTHVVLSQSLVNVFTTTAQGSRIVQQLQPGTTVTLIEGAGGRHLIAKDGNKLGFVEEKALVKLQ